MSFRRVIHFVQGDEPRGARRVKNVEAQPVGSGASLREMIRNIDNYTLP